MKSKTKKQITQGVTSAFYILLIYFNSLMIYTCGFAEAIKPKLALATMSLAFLFLLMLVHFVEELIKQPK